LLFVETFLVAISLFVKFWRRQWSLESWRLFICLCHSDGMSCWPNVAGRPAAGRRKDVAMIGGHQTLDIDFTPGRVGKTLFHGAYGFRVMAHKNHR